MTREKVVSPLSPTLYEDIDVNLNKVSDKAFRLRELHSDKFSEMNEQVKSF